MGRSQMKYVGIAVMSLVLLSGHLCLRVWAQDEGATGPDDPGYTSEQDPVVEDPVEESGTTDIEDQSFADNPANAASTRSTLGTGPTGAGEFANDTVALSLDYVNHSTVFAPGVLYSNARRRLDVGLRYFDVDPDVGNDYHGWGLGLRWRVPGVGEPYRNGLSLLAGYRDISSVGTVITGGMGGTWLVEQYPHLRVTGAARYLRFDPDAVGRSSTGALAVDAGLLWYDRVPPNDWTWSAGLRYRFDHHLAPGDQIALTVRCRPGVKPMLRREQEFDAKHVQLSGTIGIDRRNEFFFGLGVRYTWVLSTWTNPSKKQQVAR